jgi:hypothetical protein
MNGLPHTLLLLLWLTAISLTALADSDEFDETQSAPLPSPYFVDGVHCNGNRTRKVPGIFIPAEEVEIATKIEAQEECESLASLFGVQKFMWLTPEDLEKFANSLKQSGSFKEVEVSIKKSELKNHIHVFVNLTPSSKFHFSLGDAFKFYQGQSGQSNRVFDSITGELTDRRFEPIQTLNYGFALEGSYASSPPIYNPNQFSDSEQNRLSQYNYYWGDIYANVKHNYTKWLSSSLTGHLLVNDLDTSSTLRLDGSAIGDLLFSQTFFNYFMTFQIGPSVIFSTYPTSSATSSGTVFFPGIKLALLIGKEPWDYMKDSLAFYQTIGTQSQILEFSFFAQKHFTWLFNNGFALLSVRSRYVQGAVLPQDQFLFLTSEKTDLHIGLGKAFLNSGSLHQAAIQLGYEEWNTTDGRYSTMSPYLAISYTLNSEDWDLKFQAGYYFGRTY